MIFRSFVLFIESKFIHNYQINLIIIGLNERPLRNFAYQKKKKRLRNFDYYCIKFPINKLINAHLENPLQPIINNLLRNRSTTLFLTTLAGQFHVSESYHIFQLYPSAHSRVSVLSCFCSDSNQNQFQFINSN